MTNETKLIKLINNIYLYLVMTLLGLLCIYISFSILLIPVILTINEILKLKKEDELDVYRGLLKTIVKKIKANLKYAKYCPLSIYYFISIYSIMVSSSFTIMFANMFVSIAILYIIVFLANTISSANQKSKLKDLYLIYLTKYTIKQKIDMLMLTIGYSMVMFIGYLNVFTLGSVLYIIIAYAILRKEEEL